MRSIQKLPVLLETGDFSQCLPIFSADQNYQELTKSSKHFCF